MTRMREAFARVANEPSAWSASEFHVVEVQGRPVGRRVWVGKDQLSTPTAFFESGDDRLLNIEVSQAIRLASATIQNELGDALRAVQIRCLEPRLEGVFHTFLEDVIASVDAGGTVYDALASTVREWRRLLMIAREGISEQALKGLYGELSILRQIVAVHGASALPLWEGPERGRHDFVGDVVSMEVKTAALQNRQAVTIHGLRQLEPSEGSDLYLAVTEVDPHPRGELLSDLVEEIVDAGVDESGMRKRLAALGYVVDMPGTEDHRFKLVSTKYWHITESTPVLRRSVLPEAVVNAVSDLSYSLDLSALGDGFSEEFDFTRIAREES
ncbi:PD-(D/E)XK motif protein [Kaistella montana]|nr:PD-(D/E)XK motif protein [Kaistella montana]